METEKWLIGCGKGFKHGYFYKPWYRTYKAMMERCYLPTNGNYKRYGGKGVTVCEEWHDGHKKGTLLPTGCRYRNRPRR